MKKIITISLLFVFVLTGCVGQNSDQQDENNSISKRGTTAGFERPEEKPNISGIVKTIVGNEVTILKIERPEISNDNNGENIDPKKDDSEREQRSGTGGRMGMVGSMGSRINTGDEDSDERIEMLKNMSTGEEKVTIPVGIKMLKSDDGEAVIATLNNITKDQMLMIWIDKTITDRNIATFVMIK
ncbi:hypothetical protein K8R61_02085 [bacterium]|nr:hypothetical protein [bacterium]